jgi:hypothetical protein
MIMNRLVTRMRVSMVAATLVACGSTGGGMGMGGGNCLMQRRLR